MHSRPSGAGSPLLLGSTLAASCGVSQQEANWGRRRLDSLLAILLLMSAQGIFLLYKIMEGLPLGAGSAKVYAKVRRAVPPLEEDRALVGDLETVTQLVRSGKVAQAVDQAIELGQSTRSGMYFI